MSDEPRLSAEEVMDQARRQFLAAARGTLDSFAQLGEALAAEPADEETLLSMQRELHRLHGSAATFGFPRLGRMAAALESAIKKWAADPMLDPDRRAPVVARFVGSLRQQLAGDAGTNGTTPALGGHRLLLVGLKDVVAVPLTTEASSRGFHVERVSDDELEEALADGRPDGVIAASGIVAGPELDGVPLLEIDARPHDARPHDARPHDAVATLDALAARIAAHIAARIAAHIAARIAAMTPADVGSVLIVDDDPVMRTLVQVACAQAHLAVTAVADAPAFRSALTTSAPTVIVIDIEVGDVNGLVLVRETRARAATTKTPVLVLSGHTDDATRKAALEAGATDYLMKPISLPVLTAKLAAWGTRADSDS